MPEIDGNTAMSNAELDGPLGLTQEQTKKAMDAIQKMASSLSLFSYLIKTGTARKADVETHMGLLRYGFNDLNEITAGGGFLDQLLEQTRADLREANRRIRKMESEMGSGVTPDAAAGFNRLMDEAMRTWYELTGFHYGAETLYQSGVMLDFSSEIDTPETGRSAEGASMNLGRQEIADKARPVTPYAFSKDSGYDVSWDSFHGNLLDTDNNRKRLKELFTAAFPNCRMNGFESMRDRSIYILRAKVYVDYADVWAWLAGIGYVKSKEEKHEADK